MTQLVNGGQNFGGAVKHPVIPGGGLQSHPSDCRCPAGVMVRGGEGVNRSGHVLGLLTVSLIT